MPGYALYRLPRQTKVNVLAQTQGGIEALDSYGELNGRRGFVIAPFAISADTPLLLLKPDRRMVVETAELETAKGMPEAWRIYGNIRRTQAETGGPQPAYGQRETYGKDFRRFHGALRGGKFRKLVLARRVRVNARTQDPISMFRHACELYPRMFTALVSTPQGGVWLMATPETLLSGGGNGGWRTMALAGTMKLKADELDFDNPTLDNVQDIRWSQKNIQEQRYVATYISECLGHHAGDVTEEGPDTVRAANLVHLRSDFRFTLKDPDTIGDLLGALHPTPAVCGISKEDARRFIMENESITRRYYSGFAGELSPDGNTSLFVSLRCMEILQDGYDLYAGGGLLKDSVEEMEWEETSAKMETMRFLIQPSSKPILNS